MNVVCKVETVLVVGDFVVVFVWVVDILFVLLEAMVVVVEAGGGWGGTWAQPQKWDAAAEVLRPCRPVV
jgi:hypothetical protein